MGFSLLLLFMLGSYYAHPNGDNSDLIITNKVGSRDRFHPAIGYSPTHAFVCVEGRIPPPSHC